jgi:NhaP-type Na+/H+ or K+/H+ antiporter
MLDSDRPNYQRRRYRLVTKIIESIGNLFRLSDREGGKFAVKNVPLPIRRILVAESASNDGLAYPFLSIAIYLTTEASRETAFEKWIVISWLCV